MAWTTPKTDWETGELVAASDMNEIGENLAALRQPATAVGITTERITTTSDAFADVDSANMNLTITTTGGDVLVMFTGMVILAGNTPAYFDLEVDGVRLGGSDGIRSAKSLALGVVSISRLIQSLSAGSHTFKLSGERTGVTQRILNPILISGCGRSSDAQRSQLRKEERYAQ